MLARYDNSIIHGSIVCNSTYMVPAKPYLARNTGPTTDLLAHFFLFFFFHETSNELVRNLATNYAGNCWVTFIVSENTR